MQARGLRPAQAGTARRACHETRVCLPPHQDSARSGVEYSGSRTARSSWGHSLGRIVTPDTIRPILEEAGADVVRTAFQAPNMNAIAERWVLSVKSECLDRMILFGEASLRRALREYGIHFHAERPHQGLGNELIAPEQSTGSPTGKVVESERLGGLLRHYHRAAA